MGKLFCDCKTDEEKANFFLSGRAYETGVISKAIQNDVAMAYQRCTNYQKAIDATPPAPDVGKCKRWCGDGECKDGCVDEAAPAAQAPAGSDDQQDIKDAVADLRRCIAEGADDEWIVGFVRQYPFRQAAPAGDAREPVARAICAACGENPNHKGDARGNDYRWQDYLDVADSAIAAMKEKP